MGKFFNSNYTAGGTGLFTSASIKAAGPDQTISTALEKTTDASGTLLDSVFPNMIAEGTMQVVDGRIFLSGIALSDIISIIVGIISIAVLGTQVFSDLETRWHRRKMAKAEEAAVSKKKKK